MNNNLPQFKGTEGDWIIDTFSHYDKGQVLIINEKDSIQTAIAFLPELHPHTLANAKLMIASKKMAVMIQKFLDTCSMNNRFPELIREGEELLKEAL